MSRVTAPIAGPMARQRVPRPCGHGYWSFASGTDAAVRTCTTCRAQFRVTLNAVEETAEVDEL
jgi:hypothetical protein